jgi:hypothetical protein
MRLEGCPMDEKPYPPYPKNAPGPFYVEKGCCICCEAPSHEAPDLIAHDEDGGHCYFKRQPETPEEVERAIRACRVSCVGAVRYSGDDPEILRRFRELGSIDSSDALAAEWRTVVIYDQAWESLSLIEKLKLARQAVSGGKEIPPAQSPHPLFDRELDGGQAASSAGAWQDRA